MRPAMLIVALLLWSGTLAHAIPAFPGAEGWGSTATGGRGSAVVKVTNLEDRGPGSFRDAIENVSGDRIIVFDVGGVINAQTRIIIPKGDANITIAGQTAPGGITLTGAALLSKFDNSTTNVLTNIIIRHIRFRGVHNDNQGEGSGTNPLRMYNAHKVMLDHISVSWGCDQLVDFSDTDQLSMQYSILANAACRCANDGGQCDARQDPPHNLGHIAGYGKMTEHSYHKTLFANNEGRNPFINARFTDHPPTVDMRNLVGFNANINIHVLNDAQVNMIGCYFKDGDDNNNPNFFYLPENPSVYILDAVYDADRDANPHALPGQMGYHVVFRDVKRATKLSAPVPAPPVTTLSAEDGRDEVLQYVGAFPRDEVDREVIEQFHAGTGDWCKNPNITLGDPLNGPAPTDTDEDGMPDVWETANGFDPNTYDPNLDHDGDGYTNIEEYINDLALILIDQPAANLTGGVEVAYNPSYSHGEPPSSGTVLLVDFGASEAANLYELLGWENTDIDKYTDYTNAASVVGVKGGTNPKYMYANVSGPSRLFKRDDQVVVTWYNNSSAEIAFTPYISFIDPDRLAGSPSRHWHPMGVVSIDSGQTGTSTYTLTSTTEGHYSLVNINSNFDGEESNHPTPVKLVLDKIELISN